MFGDYFPTDAHHSMELLFPEQHSKWHRNFLDHSSKVASNCLYIFNYRKLPMWTCPDLHFSPFVCVLAGNCSLSCFVLYNDLAKPHLYPFTGMVCFCPRSLKSHPLVFVSLSSPPQITLDAIINMARTCSIVLRHSPRPLIMSETVCPLKLKNSTSSDISESGKPPLLSLPSAINTF